MQITQPVTTGGFLRVISISHDEKADCEWDKDTPEKGIKRWVFIISIDQSGCGYHKKSEVSPGDGKNGRKSQNLGRFSELFRQNRPLDGF